MGPKMRSENGVFFKPKTQPNLRAICREFWATSDPKMKPKRDANRVEISVHPQVHSGLEMGSTEAKQKLEKQRFEKAAL